MANKKKKQMTKQGSNMVVVHEVMNKKTKKTSFSIGSLFSIPIVCNQQSNTTRTSADTAGIITSRIDIPSNCLLTLTTACTNKAAANVRLYVSSSSSSAGVSNNTNNEEDDFVCIGTLTKQKAMTNMGIQVTSTSIRVKAEELRTIRNISHSDSVPLTVNLFGIIQPSSSFQTTHPNTNNNNNNIHTTTTATTTHTTTTPTDIPQQEEQMTEPITITTTTTDNDVTKNVSPKGSKKRKISEDTKTKTNNNNNNNDTNNKQDEKEKDDETPIRILTKKQRKQLAKQKVMELEKAVHGSREEDEDTPKKKNQQPTTRTRTSLSPLTKERRLQGGLLVRDIILGLGASSVKPGKKVSIHYEGTLADTGKVFDRNQSKSNPLSFRVGTGQVIKGLERGLDGMRAGGERMLTIPPGLGYGKKGSGDVIPKNATLHFSVKLISVGGTGKSTPLSGL